MKARVFYASFTVIMLAVSVCGCMTGSTFYTARTLRPGKFSPGFGAEDLLLKSTEPSALSITKVAIVPSFLFRLGLPLRFETDAKFIPPEFIQVSLRDQINPRSFRLFDFAPEVTFGDLFHAFSYLSYGATLSKDIGGFEPYVHYSIYDFLHYNGVDFSNNGLFSILVGSLVNNDRFIGLGVGIPLSGFELYPEVDYQYFRNDLRYGVYSFGIGIRGIPR